MKAGSRHTRTAHVNLSGPRLRVTEYLDMPLLAGTASCRRFLVTTALSLHRRKRSPTDGLSQAT